MWRCAAATVTPYSFKSRRQGSPIVPSLHEPKKPSPRPFLRKAGLEVYGQDLPPMMGIKVSNPSIRPTWTRWELAIRCLRLPARVLYLVDYHTYNNRVECLSRRFRQSRFEISGFVYNIARCICFNFKHSKTNRGVHALAALHGHLQRLRREAQVFQSTGKKSHILLYLRHHDVQIRP